MSQFLAKCLQEIRKYFQKMKVCFETIIHCLCKLFENFLLLPPYKPSPVEPDPHPNQYRALLIEALISKPIMSPPKLYVLKMLENDQHA